MRKKVMRILSLVSIVALVAVVATGYRFPIRSATVRAVGDLAVDWGVPDGDPIFVVTNFAPGETEDRNVVIVNNASTTRPVGVRGVETSEIGGLKTVLEIVVSEAGTDLYGGTSPTGTKTLDEFFTESAGPDGIHLFDLAPTQTKTVNFKVTFPESAGDEFQNTQVIFDLIIGISIGLPAECDEIDLLPSPIIGTSKAENLRGTPGNDLILGLEGADRIEGNGGDDCILGGPGADRINGNNGNDVIFGEEGADTIHGNNGDDLLVGGGGADTLRGENGEDHLIGGAAADTLEGGNNNDLLEGNEGSDTLRGNAGSDELIGGAGIDTANGGPQTDTCDAETEVSCEL